MRSTGDRQPVGKCGLCGGIVSLPSLWHSVNRPVASCEKCGAVEDEADGLPVKKMKPNPVHQAAEQGFNTLFTDKDR